MGIRNKNDEAADKVSLEQAAPAEVEEKNASNQSGGTFEETDAPAQTEEVELVGDEDVPAEVTDEEFPVVEDQSDKDLSAAYGWTVQHDVPESEKITEDA